jgi:hypothetical protein
MSTAIHDFQGLAVLQAAAAGCTPLVPDRLCYPQWFEPMFRYPHCDDIAEEAIGASEKLGHFLSCKRAGSLPVADVAALTWPQLAPLYRQLLQCLAEG